MDDTETPTTASTELTELKERYEDLQRQMTRILAGLLLVSLMLTAYLGLISRRAARDLDALRPQATQIIEASKREAPHFQAIVSKIGDYAKTDQNFRPIMEKYRGLLWTATATGAPPATVSSPAPATPAAPK